MRTYLLMRPGVVRRACGCVLDWALAVLLAGGSVGLAQPVATAPAAAPGSPLDGVEIRQIDIVGLERIDEAYVRNRIRTRAGASYSQDQLQKDRIALFRTERFIDVQADAVLVDGKVNVTFTLVEKPEVASIEFVGAEAVKSKDLSDELTFAVGDPLDLFEVRQGRDAIERLYREKGYAYATVTFDQELLDTQQRVVYQIVENQRVRVRKVRFENNIAYSASELGREVKTKSYIPIFRTGDFDPDQAEQDALAVQKYYRDRGFLDAEVSYVTEFLDVAREKLEVVFRINEGTRYRIGEIIIQGNRVLRQEELLGEMSLFVGDDLIDSTLKSDVKKLETRYGSGGYIDARVISSWVFATEPGEVILTLTIQEGRQFSVGLIEIHGNPHTQDKCVRREIGLYPEDIYDVTKMRDAEKALEATGLFIKPTVEALEPQEAPPDSREPIVRDMLVTVEENPQTNQFIAGIGASSDSGLLGNITLENRNFDLFDKPRTWGEFFRGRAYRGAGQTMRIKLEPGTEMTRFKIDFREPYLGDKPIGFGTSVYLFERGRDGYDEQRVGGNVSLDKRFRDGLLAGWIGEVALRGEYIDVDDVEFLAAEDIQDVEGGNYLSSVKLSLLHDTTDSRFDPGSGHRLNLSWEQAGVMGGDFYHAKLTGSYVQHWTVAVDEQERKSVVTAHANVGQILGDAPVFERFYAGGIGSMRGFDYRGISPRDGWKENRIGGHFMLLTGAEYSFPLYAKAIRGVFFADMGTVEEDFGINTWRAAIGAGVRITLDIFGTVPMEFDLAYPVSSDSDDDERIFSFYIGLPFF